MSNSGLLGILAETREALLRFLQLRGASLADAEDILQEVHLKLLAQSLGPVTEPRAYLYKMASNGFSLSRRTADRRARREDDWAGVHGGNDAEVNNRPTIETALIAREQLAILQRVLDGLPERTRMIFKRFRIDGETQRGIAEDLGISVSAVEKHLARAYAEIATAKLRLDADSIVPRHLNVQRGRHGN
ncbi:RNA polymerase sigma factor [Sphingomonas albertensis]|uniref:Sigma-70 family RNA polymerase sigma factor n=1 Tax=Sphingomonas albertensis TaxID=2762591 RepID=A0ABR7AKV0_9SPHN|nr:sigma-70 family RNA polymerase sigma factor [Sphingomonas albertensis]MBC3941096.1 sigma-70 family RNA polymerase sigma factor [Sphingomonas albertensis]